jgi:branched-chain amino acid transport system substrate-binding protein
VNQYIIPPGDDLTPWVTKIVDDGCQAVEAAFTELNAQSFFRVVQDQGALDGIDWGMLTSGYSLSLLDSAGDTLEGVYANSEYEPFTGGDYTPMVEDYLALAEEVGVLPTSFGEGGYLAAHIMIAVLESIEGEINRDSVQQAILEIEYENTIMGGTWRATGISPTLQPNLNSKILQVQGDDFIPKTDWRVFPLPAEG